MGWWVEGGEGVRLSGPIDDIASRCFQNEARDARAPLGDGTIFGYLMIVVVVLVFLTLLSGPLVSGPLALTGVVLAVLGVAVLPWAERKLARRYVSRAIRSFGAGDADAGQRVYQFAVREFRERIGRHRARTVGRDSEWADARLTLAEAADGAQRSAGYWRERVGQEPDNELAAKQFDVARKLEDKLQSALGKLDARADVLLKFYNDCEAKVAVMDRYTRDIDETRRLEELSGSADMAISVAEGTLSAIGQQFVREAHALGEALGGFARVQIKSLAGEAPVDNIEYLADRIIESSDSERAAIEDLDRALHGGPTDWRRTTM